MERLPTQPHPASLRGPAARLAQVADRSIATVGRRGTGLCPGVAERRGLDEGHAGLPAAVHQVAACGAAEQCAAVATGQRQAGQLLYPVCRGGQCQGAVGSVVLSTNSWSIDCGARKVV